MHKVPFFNYPHVFTAYASEFREAFEEVSKRGAFILQKEVDEFEAALAKQSGSRFALAVANGTDALVLAARAAGLGPGDEAIFCSHTFVATAEAIHLCGARPVPVECGADHLMDAAAVSEAITPKTKAIFVTQLNGRTADMDALGALVEKHKLVLIEDAAQGLGSKFKGKGAGTFGLAGTISFYPAKNLGALGDAGAILTQDEGFYETLRCMRDHGRNREGETVMWGMNSRMDNLQAAFLLKRIAHYDNIVAERRQWASLYQELLGGLSELVLPPPPSDGDHFDVYQNYEIEAERRDELKKHLADNGVGTIVQWGGRAVHQWEKLGLKASLPYTEKLFEKMLMLPMNNSLTREDVTYVCDKVREFYRG